MYRVRLSFGEYMLLLNAHLNVPEFGERFILSSDYMVPLCRRIRQRLVDPALRLSVLTCREGLRIDYRLLALANSISLAPHTFPALSPHAWCFALK